METRVALVGIIVENMNVTDKINEIIHEYAEYIIGRMGIPYRQKGISIISVILDAPQTKISALSGKQGNIPSVNSKVQYTKA